MRRGFSGGGAALTVAWAALPLLCSLPVAATEPAGSAGATPAWLDAGIATGLRELWMDPPGAIGETAEAIDHGDLWAWTGDNAKFLAVLAEADDGATGAQAAQMRSFLLRMRDGPILFKRWADTGAPLVVADSAAEAEVSNHLLTLRLDKADRSVSAELEYHDGRDKQMAAWAPAQVRVGGAWVDLAGHVTAATAKAEEGAVAIRLEYATAGLRATETFRLGSASLVHHTFDVQEGAVDQVRLRLADLSIRRPGLVESVRHYDSLHAPGIGTVPLSNAADAAGSTWMMLLDVGTSDEFASGLLVRPAPGAAWTGVAAGSGLDVTYPGSHVEERVVLLDGVLTGDLGRYGGLADNLTRPGMAGVDPGLSYEYSETVHGLLESARATGDGAAIQAAEDLLRHYLQFYPRGTQTRSLGAAVLSALLLADLGGDPRWVEEAARLGDALHAYQLQDASAAEVGAVLNEPGGGPFLDSTVMAARAWKALAAAVPSGPYAQWSEAAWGSLEAEGDHVFIRGDRADDNEWAFKTGLILQGAPDVPPDLLWAARNHAWVTLRDLAAFEFRTSRYSAEGNSETQAWMLLGLLADWRSHEGPWVIDSEGPLAPPVQESGAWTFTAPWNGSFVWVEAGWFGSVDGAPAPRVADAHGSWRYATGRAIVFSPSVVHALPAGWHELRFTGLERPVPPADLLRDLDVEIAWRVRSDGSWDHWRPQDASSTLDAVSPSDAVLVRLRAAGVLETAGDVDGRAVDLAGGSGGNASVPPMLVEGRIDDPYAYRLQGGRVEARHGGRVVAAAWLDGGGSYRMLVPAADGGGDLVLDHRAPDGRPLGEVAGGLQAGAVWQPVLHQAAADPGGAPGPAVFLLVLLASLGAAVMLALAVRGASR